MRACNLTLGFVVILFWPAKGVANAGQKTTPTPSSLYPDQGNRITPSYVAWDDLGHMLVGDAAKNQATLNPERTVYDMKRRAHFEQRVPGY
jgi:molecular chaperone DnaK (HSP70)